MSFVNSRKPNTRYLFLPYIPVFCKVGVMCIKNNNFVLLLRIECRWCGRVFCICRCCWRGQRYCRAECRVAARHKAHREAQKRYRKTEKGKKAHREAENRRRMGLTEKNERILDDTGTTHLYSCLKIVSAGLKECDEVNITPWLRIGRCHICGSWGIIVDWFPRRGYGGG